MYPSNETEKFTKGGVDQFGFQEIRVARHPSTIF